MSVCESQASDVQSTAASWVQVCRSNCKIRFCLESQTSSRLCFRTGYSLGFSLYFETNQGSMVRDSVEFLENCTNILFAEFLFYLYFSWNRRFSFFFLIYLNSSSVWVRVVTNWLMVVLVACCSTWWYDSCLSLSSPRADHTWPRTFDPHQLMSHGKTETTSKYSQDFLNRSCL